MPEDLGHFDLVISNPPFGSVPRTNDGPRYKGREFEYHLIDQASDMADYGVFIVPAESASFRMSGVQCYTSKNKGKHIKFTDQTGIDIEPNCGIDTEMYRSQWKNANPVTEVIVCDFEAARERRGQVECSSMLNISDNIPQGTARQLSLFDIAA